MNAEWYYAQSGQQKGPVSQDQLKDFAASGELKPGDLVWKDGMSDWQAASAVLPELFAKPAGSPPPPPSPGGPPPLAGPERSVGEYRVPLPAFLRKRIVPSLHNQRLFFLASTALTFISMIFPWATSSLGELKGSVSGFNFTPDAYLILLLTVPATVLSLMDAEKQKPIEGNMLLGAAIPSGLAALYCFIDVFRAWETQSSGTLFGQSINVHVRPGFGLFLTFLVTSAATAGAWLLVAKSESEPGANPPSAGE